MSHEHHKRHPRPDQFIIPSWMNVMEAIDIQARFLSAVRFLERERESVGWVTEAAHDAYVDAALRQSRLEEGQRVLYNGGMRLKGLKVLFRRK